MTLKEMFVKEGTYNHPERVFNVRVAQYRESDGTMRPYQKFGMKFVCLYDEGLDFRSWSEATRDGAEKAPKLFRRHLLCTEKKEFLLLSILWEPQEEYDEDRMSRYPDRFWYVASTITLQAVDLQMFLRSRRRTGPVSSAFIILQRIRNIVGHITTDLEGALRMSRKRLGRHDARLRRLGY